jgi:hypothetical protein
MVSGRSHTGHEVLDMRVLNRCKGLGAAALCAGMLASFVAPVAYAGPGLTGPTSFERFCSTWMGKLAERERFNLKNAAAKARKDGNRVVVEYVGYGKSPTRCEAKPSGVPSNPFVGKLTYKELRYERAGSSKDGALSSQPRVLSTTEVMEIFRFDGSRWVY